jgi:RimJ/RimL family protein N-acetyltransferase
MDRSHAAALVAAANESRATFAYTWVPETVDAAETFIGGVVDDLQHGRSLPFTVEWSGRIVGATRFLDIDYFPWPFAGAGVRASVNDDPRAVEIGGTWYAASAQRTEVNTRCKLMLLQHAFETWGVERVSLKTDARNGRSRQAIERIGATFEGVRRVHMVGADGTIRDSAYFSMVAAEWPAVRAHLLAKIDV